MNIEIDLRLPNAFARSYYSRSTSGIGDDFRGQRVNRFSTVE
ncbi:MAG: hypothetical protein WBD20_13655 [Pirellulaceae bacterium]